MFKCPESNCKKEYNNITSLGKHWSRSHKLLEEMKRRQEMYESQL